MTYEAFKPVTRDMACETLGVSKGTLEKLISDGVLPAPASLGDRRLQYWHPEAFYGALDRALRATAPQPREAVDHGREVNAERPGRRRATDAATSRAISRQSEHLRQLNQ